MLSRHIRRGSSVERKMRFVAGDRVTDEDGVVGTVVPPVNEPGQTSLHVQLDNQPTVTVRDAANYKLAE
jgi:hypothetical protein